MATRDVTLFVNGPYPVGDPLAPGRFISSPTSAAAPTLPPIVAGDIWNIKLYYYLGDGSPGNPFFNYRFADTSTKVQITARGNGIVYAQGTSSSEISDTGGVGDVTIVAPGGNGVTAQHVVTFDANAGTFTITFPAPNLASLHPVSTAAGVKSYFAQGTTAPIPAGASAQEIQDALNNGLNWRECTTTSAGALVITNSNLPLSSVPAKALFVVTNSVPYKSFKIYLGSNQFNPAPWPYYFPAAQFDGSGLRNPWGWNITLPLDGNGHTFSDYFLATNKPAYLEALLFQGAGSQIAAEKLLPSESETPVFTSSSPGGGRVGNVYNFTYAATHAPTFAVTAGTLPNGLNLGADGVLSGIPTVAGTFTGTVTATNAFGSANQNFSIVILPPLPSGAAPPTFTSGAPDPGRVGDAYSFPLAVTQPAEFSIASGSLPFGLSLSIAGVISGTPTTAGVFTGVFVATNTNGSATQDFAILIVASDTGGGGGGGGPITEIAGAFYDGDYTAATTVGGLESETLIENVPYSLVYRQKYHQLLSSWRPVDPGSACPFDSNFQLVFETPRINIGAGVVEWTREWAYVPPQWNSAEIVNFQVTYAFQSPIAPNPWYLVTYMISRKATVTHTYIAANDPSSIPTRRMPRAFVYNNGSLLALDGFTNPTPGERMIASDDELVHYRGRIWERIERYITF